MRTCLTVSLLLVVLLAGGCLTPSPLTVSLASPANGSTVLSLTPTFTWGGGAGGATYRLQVAGDINFQNVVLDANNIGDLSFTMPAGKLTGGGAYYWKVLAQQGNRVSNWTLAWSFYTPANPSATGNVRVSATLNGSAWSGSANYRISGPYSDTDNSVPWDFQNIPVGKYTITYNYGGPQGASLTGITPQPTLDLPAGQTIHFVLNFASQTGSSIQITAALNGAPWSGNVNYSISGPFRDSDVVVPKTFGNLPGGTYTLTYNSGGPAGAVLTGISPAPTQNLAANGSISYTLNFSTATSSSLSVTASYNGAIWVGPVQYTITGPVNNTYNSIPLQLPNPPPGTYYISYKNGGPPGATLGSIAPGPSLVLSTGSSAGFVLNYYAQQQTGNLLVNATLNGTPWTGGVMYSITGPFRSDDNQVPRTYNGVPTGVYTLTYLGGGPAGATFTNISPSPTQSLASGRTIGFNLNFTSQPVTGRISVSATVDGQQWVTQPGSGPISYTISGPAFDSGSTIPGSFDNKPAGLYTLNYNSGGPIGATLTQISPSPTQNLPAGGSIQYVLQFTGQPKGRISVIATLNGEEWTGSVGYVVTGPYVESADSAPRSFEGAPQGSYSVQYSGGGPPQSTFIGVSPQSQMLPPGGSITFTLMFQFQGGVEPGPMPGPIPEPVHDGDSPLLQNSQ